MYRSAFDDVMDAHVEVEFVDGTLRGGIVACDPEEPSAFHVRWENGVGETIPLRMVKQLRFFRQDQPTPEIQEDANPFFGS